MGLKFSIIIPVYNAASYLRDCLDSVVNQLYSDWEAICVDDGSTDGSSAILDEYATKDVRFVVIHQVNAGVSAARNQALERASGTWIFFLDADDVLSPHCFQCCAQLISARPSVDMIRYGMRQFLHVSECDWSDPSDAVITEYDFAQDRIEMNNAVHFGTQAYKKALLDGVRFPPLSYAEDPVFAYRAICRVTRLCVINAAFYFYRIQDGSATRSKMTKRKLLDLLSGVEAVVRVVNDGAHRFCPVAERQTCNKITELFYSFLCEADLKPLERDELLRMWYQILSEIKELHSVRGFQYARMAVISALRVRFVAWVLCSLPFNLKKGIYRCRKCS